MYLKKARLQWHDALLMPCAFASRNFQLFSNFIVQTDHKPLLFLAKGKTTNSRLMRWALALQQFTFSVQAIAGNDNYHADVLSRLV